MPTARQSAGAVVEKNIIYVVGGYSFAGGRLNTVESYDPATNAWTELAPLLVGKSEPSVGLVGTTIVAADGDTTSGDTGDNEGFDALTNTWSSLASDSQGRNEGCSGTIGAKFYVMGGGNSGGTAVNVAESFTLKTNAWKSLASVPQAAAYAAEAVYKGRLFCFGGSSSTAGGTVYDNVQIYQP